MEEMRRDTKPGFQRQTTTSHGRQAGTIGDGFVSTLLPDLHRLGGCHSCESSHAAARVGETARSMRASANLCVTRSSHPCDADSHTTRHKIIDAPVHPLPALIACDVTPVRTAGCQVAALRRFRRARERTSGAAARSPRECSARRVRDAGSSVPFARVPVTLRDLVRLR